MDLRSRVRLLLDLLREDRECTVYLSGYNGEAEVMYTLLTGGVMEEELSKVEIILEKDSGNTINQILYIADNIDGPVTVVTSDYHKKRVEMLLSNVGREDVPVVGSRTKRMSAVRHLGELARRIFLRVIGLNNYLKLSNVYSGLRVKLTE